MIQTTANATLTQMLNVVFQRLEFGGANASSAALSVIQRDAFLVFRSLCKLSMKPLPDPLPSEESIELRSKLLSLQLLYSIIQNSGAKFRSGEKFIWAIRQYLCLSLLKNGARPPTGASPLPPPARPLSPSFPPPLTLAPHSSRAGVSPIASILQLSLDIFVTLDPLLQGPPQVRDRRLLLEHPAPHPRDAELSGQQKLLVVQSLRVLVRDPQLIVDLFLNYDCDLEGKGIFSSMCDDLSRLSCTVHVETTEQDALLKTLALEMLVDITDSMVQWERDNKDGAADGAPRRAAAAPPRRARRRRPPPTATGRTAAARRRWWRRAATAIRTSTS